MAQALTTGLHFPPLDNNNIRIKVQFLSLQVGKDTLPEGLASIKHVQYNPVKLDSQGLKKIVWSCKKTVGTLNGYYAGRRPTFVPRWRCQRFIIPLNTSRCFSKHLLQLQRNLGSISPLKSWEFIRLLKATKYRNGSYIRCIQQQFSQLSRKTNIESI